MEVALVESPQEFQVSNFFSQCDQSISLPRLCVRHLTHLVLDIDDPSGSRSDPFRGDETLHTGFLGGFNPGNLKMEMLPCYAGDEDFDSIQLPHQSSPRTVQIVPDNFNALLLQLLVGMVVDRGISCE